MGSDLDGNRSVDEVDLLRRFAAGDRHAATELAQVFLPMCLRYARRMLGDPVEAEDVAQEAMIRLWRVAPEWRSGEAKVSTWLYRVTANLCVDRMRRKPAQTFDEISEPEDPSQTVLDRLQDQTRMDALQIALLSLPDRQRQAVVLRHIEGLSNPEIASIMDISARAVESLTARGKSALEDYFDLAPALEAELRNSGKTDQLEQLDLGRRGGEVADPQLPVGRGLARRGRGLRGRGHFVLDIDGFFGLLFSRSRPACSIRLLTCSMRTRGAIRPGRRTARLRERR